MTLNKDDEQEITKYRTLVKKCRSLAASMHQSCKLSEVFTDKQIVRREKPLKVIQDIRTRWNSTFLMISRIEERIEVN